MAAMNLILRHFSFHEIVYDFFTVSHREDAFDVEFEVKNDFSFIHINPSFHYIHNIHNWPLQHFSQDY